MNVAVLILFLKNTGTGGKAPSGHGDRKYTPMRQGEGGGRLCNNDLPLPGKDCKVMRSILFVKTPVEIWRELG